MLSGMNLGIKQARDTIENAASKVTASADTIAKAIGIAVGLAVVALAVALAALVKSRPAVKA